MAVVHSLYWISVRCGSVEQCLRLVRQADATDPKLIVGDLSSPFQSANRIIAMYFLFILKLIGKGTASALCMQTHTLSG